MIFTFDPPETGWTLIDASINADPTAPSQPNSLTLNPASVDQNGVAYRTLTGLTVGTLYDFWIRINWDDEPNTDARVQIKYNGSSRFTMRRPVDEDNNPRYIGWELRLLGSFSYNIADKRFEISRPDGSGPVYVDTIYIGETPTDTNMAGKWAAIDAANNTLRAIDGTSSGFNSNFDERCYSRLFFPAEAPDVKLPYTCLPLDQEAERIEYEGFGFISKWRMTGFAFFEDNPESDPLNSLGTVSAALCRDDLIRMFMGDQTLGGTVQNCEVIEIDTAAGSQADPYVWVLFTLEFTQELGASDLAAA